MAVRSSCHVSPSVLPLANISSPIFSALLLAPSRSGRSRCVRPEASMRCRSHRLNNFDRSQADCRHAHQKVNYSLFIVGKAVRVEFFAYHHQRRYLRLRLCGTARAHLSRDLRGKPEARVSADSSAVSSSRARSRTRRSSAAICLSSVAMCRSSSVQRLDNDARQVAVHVLHLRCKPSDVKYALRRDNPLLGQVTAQCIDRPRPLPDQEVPGF